MEMKGLEFFKTFYQIFSIFMKLVHKTLYLTNRIYILKSIKILIISV